MCMFFLRLTTYPPPTKGGYRPTSFSPIPLPVPEKVWSPIVTHTWSPIVTQTQKYGHPESPTFPEIKIKKVIFFKFSWSPIVTQTEKMEDEKSRFFHFSWSPIVTHPPKNEEKKLNFFDCHGHP